MHRGLATVILLAAVFAMPSAAGQVASVQVAISPASATAPEGEFLVTVTNQGSAPGQVTLDARAPDGWMIELEETSFMLQGGESRGIAAAYTADRSGTLTIRATMTVGQPPVSQTDIAQDSVSVTLANTNGTEAFPWWLAGVAVAVLLGVFIFIARGRPGVELMAPIADITVPPGGAATFLVEIRNRQSKHDAVEFALQGPEGWGLELDRERVDLRPKRRAPVKIHIQVPKEAKGVHQVSLAAHTEVTDKTAVLDLVVRV